MLEQSTYLGRLTQGLAALALLASVGALGLFELPLPGQLFGTALSAAAIALSIAALMGLRELSHERGVALPEFAGALVRAILGGLVFLAAVYHLSWLFRTFAVIHVAIDALVPLWVDHALGLAPGILIILAAEIIQRQPAQMSNGGILKPHAHRQEAGRN